MSPARRVPSPYVAALCVASFLFFHLGCGRQPANGIITGKLLVGGQPAPGHARVVLMSMKTGAAAAADVRADGTFAAAKRLAPGPYVAFLVPARFAEEAPDSTSARNHARRTDTTAPAPAVPAKYWDEGTSPWTVDVVAGLNDIRLIAEP